MVVKGKLGAARKQRVSRHLKSFADREAYAAYDAHPQHRDFVERRWLPTVTAFEEADFAIEVDAVGTAVPWLRADEMAIGDAVDRQVPVGSTGGAEQRPVRG